MSLGEGTLREQTALDFLVGQFAVTIDDNLAYLHLLLLVDDHVEDDAVTLSHVLTLQNFDVGIFEALVVEVFLGQDLRAVNHVGVDAHAGCHAELLLQVLTFRLLHADVVDGRHTWTRSQMDVQIDAVAHDRIGADGDVREQSVAPVALHGICYLHAGNLNFLSYGESADAGKGIVLVAIHTRYVDASQHERAWRACIRDVGVGDDVLCRHVQSNKKR